MIIYYMLPGGRFRMKWTKLVALCLAVVLSVLITGCGDKDTVNIEDVESLTQVVNEAELHALKEYPNLRTLDISGSTCYPAIMKFVEDCPHVDVTYTVTLGGSTISNKETSATLESEGLDFDTLQKHLRYLPKLDTVTLNRTGLSAEELAQLSSIFTRIRFHYTVDILGTEYRADAATVDLSKMEPGQIEDICGKLRLLPLVTEAELMAGSDSALTMTDVKTLMDAAPEVSFHYTFDLFGKTVSTADEAVEFVKVNIGNQGEEQIRQALDILPNCKRFLLDSCGLDNEVLAGIREDYPNTKVAWRVTFGKYSMLTDAEILRAVYNVFDRTVGDLKYCNDVKYIDMGHNEELSDISFISYMPKLEICILSGSLISDLTPFASCPNLEFLEIAYCSKVTDVSPLENCKNLRFLNISFARVENLMPLDNLPLERFVYLNPKASLEEQQFFKDFHPDCWTRFSGEDPYSLGWRYDDSGETFSEFYKKMREIFHYDKMN